MASILAWIGRHSALYGCFLLALGTWDVCMYFAGPNTSEPLRALSLVVGVLCIICGLIFTALSHGEAA